MNNPNNVETIRDQILEPQHGKSIKVIKPQPRKNVKNSPTKVQAQGKGYVININKVVD